jgi:hypothetical protein
MENILRPVSGICEKRLLASSFLSLRLSVSVVGLSVSFHPSIHPSAWNSSALTGQVVMEFENVFLNEARKCLLSFGVESFVFQVAIQKFKD